MLAMEEERSRKCGLVTFFCTCDLLIKTDQCYLDVKTDLFLGILWFLLHK